MVKTCSMDECTKGARTRGLCSSHYEHLRRQGAFEGQASPRSDTDARYESKIDRSGGGDACHPWTASCNEYGYGNFRADGKMQLAHRWGYQRFVGTLQSHEVVRHTCDNPPCQNQQHWLHGSVADNVNDMVSRGRVNDRQGRLNPRAKLTESQVREIRASSEPLAIVADRYNVSRQLIGLIRNRKVWRHVADPLEDRTDAP